MPFAGSPVGEYITWPLMWCSFKPKKILSLKLFLIDWIVSYGTAKKHSQTFNAIVKHLLIECMCICIHTPSTYPVCTVSCDPGFELNLTDCSCVLYDGCEAAGQPCQNGGSCFSHHTAPPYYTCLCDDRYTGQNCNGEYPCI